MLLYTGKIAVARRHTTAGFARGHPRANGTCLEILLQNENVIAWVHGAPVAVLSHMFCVLGELPIAGIASNPRGDYAAPRWASAGERQTVAVA